MTVPLTESTGCYMALSKETGEELNLAMQRLWLTGQVTPFGARLLVEHTFESGEPRPVEAIYAFMLPQDAALRSFRVSGEGFEIESDLRLAAEAVTTYEQGVDDGSLSVLARQYADGMMNLTVGNLQPGETVRVILEIFAGVERHDNGFRFRFPFTLAPAYHREARSIAVPGGGDMELPPEGFGDLILPRWKKDASNLHQVGFDLQLVGGQALAQVSSPSHGVKVAGENSRRRIGLAVAAEVPDRDLVLEAHADQPWALAWAFEGSISALLGSTRFGEPDATKPRRVVFVLDRSGSMAGRRIKEAKRAIGAGIAAMRPDDQFSIVAFDHEVEALSRGLLEASDENRESARQFLGEVDSRGGTQLAAALDGALSLVGPAGGDLLLLTDGEVFGTAEILSSVRNVGVRIHTLGIGSASQDRFLAQLGRETGGCSRYLTARERVDLALLDLFAAVSSPVATDVEVEATGETLVTEDVFPGLPMLVREAGSGAELAIGWSQGDFELPVVEAPAGLGETLWLLDGAARITAAESCMMGELAGEEAGKLEALSRKYGLASRAMALVAVVRRESDRPGEMPHTQVVPVGLPHDLEPDVYFASSCDSFALGASLLRSAGIERGGALGDYLDAEPDPTPASRLFGRRLRSEKSSDIALGVEALDEDEDRLLDDASRLEADGGMPGASLDERIAASFDLLERLIAAGSSRALGPFRHHVRRLLEFLGDAVLDAELSDRLAALATRAVGRTRA